MLEHGKATKGMTMRKIPLIKLIATIHLINHQKQQPIDFWRKYQCITYVRNSLERKCKLQKFTRK